MGRRKNPHSRPPITTADYMALAAERLNKKGGAFEAVNRAQFTAQLYETTMVKVIAGIAMDATVPASIRKSAALDVVQIARGRIREWVHDGQTINPAALLANGASLTEGMAEAEANVDLYLRLDELVRAGVPPEEWPDAIKAVAGDDLALYAEKPAVPAEDG